MVRHIDRGRAPITIEAVERKWPIAHLTKVPDIIRRRTFQAFFPLVSTALIYFAVIALCGWALGLAGRLLDPKLRRPDRILKGVTTR